MRRAARLTRAADVAQATRVIQDALAGGSDARRRGSRIEVEPSQRPQQPTLRLIEPDAETVENAHAHAELTGVLPTATRGRWPRRRRRRASDAKAARRGVAALREGRLRTGALGRCPA